MQSFMNKQIRLLWLLPLMLLACLPAAAQPPAKRKIIIDQDAAGPGGTDQQSILL